MRYSVMFRLPRRNRDDVGGSGEVDGEGNSIAESVGTR